MKLDPSQALSNQKQECILTGMPEITSTYVDRMSKEKEKRAREQSKGESDAIMVRCRLRENPVF